MSGATLLASMVVVVVLAGLASWTLPTSWRAGALLAGGAGLLGLASWPSLICLSAATVLTYALARLRDHRLLWSVVGCAGLVASYLGLLWRIGHPAAGDALRVVLPLGMAYYVLRLLHYVIGAERGGFRTHSFVDYAAYQFFPATLPVGPINRFDAFLRDLRRRRWDPDQMSAGAGRVLAGGAKIVLLGNLLLNNGLAPWLTATAAPWPAAAFYAGTLVFWLNIYVQFSGYSSLAIGVGALLGFNLPENFHWPFLARNIGEFWRRWHMTLSAWCRDYVYTPVLAQWRRPALASALSMVVLGVWHEVSVHYLVWGLYHATGLTVWRRFSARYDRVAPRLSPGVRGAWRGAAHLLTLHFVMFSYPVANAVEALLVSR